MPGPVLLPTVRLPRPNQPLRRHLLRIPCDWVFSNPWVSPSPGFFLRWAKLPRIAWLPMVESIHLLVPTEQRSFSESGERRIAGRVRLKLHLKIASEVRRNKLRSMFCNSFVKQRTNSVVAGERANLSRVEVCIKR